jgi:hypothetical protein
MSSENLEVASYDRSPGFPFAANIWLRGELLCGEITDSSALLIHQFSVVTGAWYWTDKMIFNWILPKLISVYCSIFNSRLSFNVIEL